MRTTRGMANLPAVRWWGCGWLTITALAISLTPRNSFVDAAFSIAATDRISRQMGAAGANCNFFAVGESLFEKIYESVANSSVFIHQAVIEDIFFEIVPLTLTLMENGTAPETILDIITDPLVDGENITEDRNNTLTVFPSYTLRQYGLVDLLGQTPAGYTGSELDDYYDLLGFPPSIQSDMQVSTNAYSFTAQGSLVTQGTVNVMAIGFEGLNEDTVGCDLADRLMLSLVAVANDTISEPALGNSRCIFSNVTNFTSTVAFLHVEDETGAEVLSIEVLYDGTVSDPIAALRSQYAEWRSNNPCPDETAPPAAPSEAPSISAAPSPVVDTPSPTTVATPGPTPGPTPGATPGPTPSPTPRATPGPTPVPTPGVMPSPTPSPTPGATPGPTTSPTPRATPGPSPSPTPRATPSPTPGPTPRATPSPTPGPTPRATPSPTPSPTVPATDPTTPNPVPPPVAPTPRPKPTRYPKTRWHLRRWYPSKPLMEPKRWYARPPPKKPKPGEYKGKEAKSSKSSKSTKKSKKGKGKQKGPSKEWQGKRSKGSDYTWAPNYPVAPPGQHHEIGLWNGPMVKDTHTQQGSSNIFLRQFPHEQSGGPKENTSQGLTPKKFVRRPGRKTL